MTAEGMFNDVNNVMNDVMNNAINDAYAAC